MPARARRPAPGYEATVQDPNHVQIFGPRRASRARPSLNGLDPKPSTRSLHERRNMSGRLITPSWSSSRFVGHSPLIRSNVLAGRYQSASLVSESGLTDNQLQYALRMAYDGKAPNRCIAARRVTSC